MILRWQVGDFGPESWRALNLSIRLMKRLEPSADYFVVHQGDCKAAIAGVFYVKQEPLYSHGRFYNHLGQPGRIDPSTHEVTIENDHLMWALPPAWERWKASSNAALVWTVDWDYYGNYSDRVGPLQICPGIYGLPPGLVFPPPPVEERGQDAEEQGFIAWWLNHHGPHEVITHEEVSCYMPTHPILGPTHNKLGTCGTHFAGLNRQWNPLAGSAMDEIERKWL